MSRIKDRVSIYTDGSVINGCGGFAAVLMCDSPQGRLRKTVFGGIDSNEEVCVDQVEVIAIIAGLNMLREPSIVSVFTDSKRIVGCYNNKRMIMADGVDEELVRRFYEATRRHQVSMSHIKGHSGHDGNEWAHKHAKMEAYRVMKRKEKGDGSTA